MTPTSQLIHACQRNIHLYSAHHLHLTFDEGVGASLYSSLRDTGKITIVDLPLGSEAPALMFARTKPQYLTTIVFASVGMLLDNLAMLEDLLRPAASLDDVVLGWKLEGLVVNGRFAAPRQPWDMDFCYIEHHAKFPHASLAEPLPPYVGRQPDAHATANNPMSDAALLWSYSRKNRALMTAMRLYRRQDLDWCVRNVTKFEVCYYESWLVEYEAEWLMAQARLRRGRHDR